MHKPLRKGVFIKGDSNEKSWLPFKYENLPSFCFGYGWMGHSLKNVIRLLKKSRIYLKMTYLIRLLLKLDLLFLAR